MQPLPDEPNLILAARRGEKDAISALYQAHVDAIYRYMDYRVESAQIAEDLTAEVFLRMVQHLPGYQDTGLPFAAWLFRIAANLLTDHRRRSRRTPQNQLSEEQASDDTDPFGTIERREEEAQLRKALRTLPEEQQTLLILRFMQQLPHQEVAAILNKSEANIRVMQHRALQSLAHALGDVAKVRSYMRGNKQHE